MKTLNRWLLPSSLMLAILNVQAQSYTVQTAPPVVVKTVPVAGATGVDPDLGEIRATFSKQMTPGNFSVVRVDKESFPALAGAPKFADNDRTCIVPVKLEPNKEYVLWLNTEQYKNFTDTSGRSAVPYLLSFSTGAAKNAADAAAGKTTVAETPPDTFVPGPSREFLPNLNPSQKAVLAWTDRQFRSFFDNRTFDGWSHQEKEQLETKLIDALKGPKTQEYFHAINTLGTMRSTKALPALREIAYNPADKNNRDRWMAIRSLGLIGQREDVPELIHLVYHGNSNTHWWAQISLVKITGQNFGSDWEAWGKWWKDQKGQPPYKPEIRKWWSGQAEVDKLAESLAEGDKKFLESIGGPVP